MRLLQELSTTAIKLLFLCLALAIAQANAATITVKSSADAGGTCPSATCTLRQAIATANSGDTISFSNSTAGGATNFYGSQHTITLTSGDLLLTSNLNIQGPGVDLLAIDGDAQNANGVVGNANGSRIFSINGSIVIMISNLTITNGNGKGNNFGNTQKNGAGGGIFINAGDVTLQSVVLSNNIETNPNAFGGGAIDKEGSGTLTIRDNTIVGNTSALSGGGILVDFGTLVLSGTTIANNTTSATGTGYGGGIENYATIQLSNCTISGNHADNQSGLGGGGIYTSVTGNSSIANCTISGNSASGTNSAGGLRADYNDAGGKLTLINTIIAGNTGTNGATPDVNNNSGGTFTSGGHNLIGDGTGATGFTSGTNGDQVGTNTMPINPNLGPLANNGGPTQTQALQTGSPAINMGDDCVTTNTCTGVTLGAALTTDQRGAGYARKSGAHVDIGAFEVQAPTAAPVTVGGRVMTTSGRGINNVRVSLTDSQGNIQYARTNAFGFYRFANLTVGEIYILNVSSKRYVFDNPTQVINVTEDLTELNFTALTRLKVSGLP